METVGGSLSTFGLLSGKNWCISPRMEKDHEPTHPTIPQLIQDKGYQQENTSGQKLPLFSTNPKNHRPGALLLAFRLTSFPDRNRILQACSLPFSPSSSLTWKRKHSQNFQVPPTAQPKTSCGWIGAKKGGLRRCVYDSSFSHTHPSAIAPKTKLPLERMLPNSPTIDVDSNLSLSIFWSILQHPPLCKVIYST